MTRLARPAGGAHGRHPGLGLWLLAAMIAALAAPGAARGGVATSPTGCQG